MKIFQDKRILTASIGILVLLIAGVISGGIYLVNKNSSSESSSSTSSQSSRSLNSLPNLNSQALKTNEEFEDKFDQEADQGLSSQLSAINELENTEPAN